MSEMTVNKQALASPGIQGLKESNDEIWPAAVIVVGLSLSVAWVIFLGYGLFKIIEAAI